MGTVRQAAVAGTFYPGDPKALAAAVASLLEAVPPGDDPAPKAIVAPHAGYVYSGPVAARVYARLKPARQTIRRVVILGPSHRVAFRGIATSGAASFETPLGAVPLDRMAIAALTSLKGVGESDRAHSLEHAIEVHLPFLQTLLNDFSLVPLVVGDARPEDIATVIDAAWGGPETLVVISSDLSHYLDYDAARGVDLSTRQAVERLDPAAIGRDQACGRLPLAGLLLSAKRRSMAVETLDLRNSGDTAGPRDRVVGYGAWAFHEDPRLAAEGASWLERHGPTLLALARGSAETWLRSGHRISTAEWPQALIAPGASFVTWKRGGQLRGCIGSPNAWRPLAEDVADNAIKSATADPRFPPVTLDELAGLDLSVSVLTSPQPMVFASQEELLTQLRVGIDGLIIEDAGRRALFLPAVWEALPDPREFLMRLKLKAGLTAQHFSQSFRASRFQAIEFRETAGPR